MSYAAALLVGALTDEDIVDLVRRGFTVRPFPDIDSTLAGLVLGLQSDRIKCTTEDVHNGHPPALADRPGVAMAAANQVATERTYDGEFASQLCTQLDPALPNGPIRELVHLCARKTRKRLTVDQAAQAIGIERTKLTALLNEARYPSADEVIRWLRLLHAAWLLSRTPRRSVEDVATALAFASGPSMSNTMKNITGIRPTELAERGGFNLVLAQFRRMLDQAKASDGRTEVPSTA